MYAYTKCQYCKFHGQRIIVDGYHYNKFQSTITCDISKQQVLKKEISKISKIADARNTIKELKEARRAPNFISSERLPIGKYDQIHTMLHDAQKLAEDLAYEALDSEMKNGIQQRILIKKINDRNATQGIIPTTRY